MLIWLKRIAALSAITFIAACGGSDDPPPALAPIGNVVEVAQSNSDFSILVEAVTAADLGATLSGPGPFTVFAPTNAAFGVALCHHDDVADRRERRRGIVTAAASCNQSDRRESGNSFQPNQHDQISFSW